MHNLFLCCLGFVLLPIHSMRIPCNVTIFGYCSGWNMHVRAVFKDPVSSVIVSQSLASRSCLWNSEGSTVALTGVLPAPVHCSTLSYRLKQGTNELGPTIPLMSPQIMHLLRNYAHSCVVEYVTTANCYPPSGWFPCTRYVYSFYVNNTLYRMAGTDISSHGWLQITSLVRTTTTCMYDYSTFQVNDTYLDEVGQGCSYVNRWRCPGNCKLHGMVRNRNGCNREGVAFWYDLIDCHF